MPNRRAFLGGAALAGAARPAIAQSSVRVTRAFVDTPAGQIHIRRAGKTTSAVPVVCFHQSPQSSLVYADVLLHLGERGLAIACDTPGFGESFRPTVQPTIANYAEWLAEVPAALGLSRVDIVGMFTGSAIAVELCRTKPELVRRAVLIGPALFDEDQRKQMLATAWPEMPAEDGGFLNREWKRVFDRYPKSMPFAQRFAAFNEYYRGGLNARFGEVAVNSYDMNSALSGVRQPVLVIDPDGTFGRGRAAADRLADATYLKAEGRAGLGLLQTEHAWVAETIAAFFDQS